MLGLVMQTNTQQNGGRWPWLAAMHEQGDRPGPPGGDFPEADEASRSYTIREMARDFRVSIRTLRFYEDRGLLHPRREGTSRRYNARDRLYLKMILKGKSLGFTLSEIRDILAGQEQSPGKMDLEMGLLPEQITAQIEHLERQRSQIDEALKTLREAQRDLLESPALGTGRKNNAQE